jgi:CDP-Glycerol:Poly(glycerophosphate) glycerophosphotransferase
MKRVRVLALDHFFDQDLRSLESVPQLDVRRFPYQRLRRRALRIMGDPVGRGLVAYNDPALAHARGRYAAWLAREVQRLYLEKPFDVMVLPSDTFFYVRTLPAAVHRLGVPVVVVQKETTISQATMETFSREVGAAAPFISDFMTVCSERQREFWVRAGADAGVIEVTGQPRFDVYATAKEESPSTPRHVLFLTYALDAYVPGAGRGDGSPAWQSLREETEAALLDQVRAGACEVVVKCHPQQDRAAEARRLAALAGPLWKRGISIAAQDADTRDVIMAADVVVGFQTTALYEAVAARRNVIYAAWGDAYERHRAGLIPFDSAPSGCVRHAQSQDELRALLTAPPPPHLESCEPWYEEALGVVDGKSADRVAARLTAIATAATPTELRNDLDRRRRRYAIGLLARAGAAEAVWTAALPAAAVTGQQHRVAARRRRARDDRRIATRTLTDRDVSRGEG